MSAHFCAARSYSDMAATAASEGTTVPLPRPPDKQKQHRTRPLGNRRRQTIMLQPTLNGVHSTRFIVTTDSSFPHSFRSSTSRSYRNDRCITSPGVTRDTLCRREQENTTARQRNLENLRPYFRKAELTTVEVVVQVIESRKQLGAPPFRCRCSARSTRRSPFSTAWRATM